MLSHQLQDLFTRRERQRGNDYFLERRVQLHGGGPDFADAQIRGTEPYDVSIRLEDRTLSLECSCPYAVSNGVCKHLWALILAADAHGYLSLAAGCRHIALRSEETFDDESEAGFLPEVFDLQPRPGPQVKRVAPWRLQLDAISNPPKPLYGSAPKPWPERREVQYVIDVDQSRAAGGLVMQLMFRERKGQGSGWNKSKELRITRGQLDRIPDPVDREALSVLAGAIAGYSSYGFFDGEMQSHWRLTASVARTIVPPLAQAGRLWIRQRGSDLQSLNWDARAWKASLGLSEQAEKVNLHGLIRCGEEQVELAAPPLVTENFVFFDDRVALLELEAPFRWIAALRSSGPIVASSAERDDLLAAVLEIPHLGGLSVPGDMQFEQVTEAPRPLLRIRTEQYGYAGNRRLEGTLLFDYGGHVAPRPGAGVFDSAARRFYVCDPAAEHSARETLSALGLNTDAKAAQTVWIVPAKRLPEVVQTLTSSGWQVEATGKLIRSHGSAHLNVSSGIDWFELHAEVEFDGRIATLPQLLAAVKRGENMVRLDDGSYGLLPEEWLARIAPFAGLGKAEKDHIRFRPSQAGLLDALLAAQPEAACDEQFATIRRELTEFDGVRSAEQPGGFVGQLRDYQKEGLGWFQFLERFGLGGCLADDMGVGKTAQVLALLEGRRAAGVRKPSLVVVPKSLVFNWKQEAARFTPQLKIHDYTGSERSLAELDDVHLVLTTYGTLRRDAASLQGYAFDYVILDEAQAIKNAATESAKAVRLLQADHRLALSGTPVENHLGELWSLFEFLNPGMLGAASAFQSARGLARTADEASLKLLAHALRPFILRRTKQQVARELPPKTEQTIYCEMEPAHRELYDELRSHYRLSLLGRIDKQGLAKSKMHVLEALLRLRQAACHPGLIDKKRTREPSAKLDTLCDQLSEIVEEGHKALVFSQFTSLLAIVRERLDADGVVYEYLDGATRDRQARVERFQSDPACPIFLISLKAGGLGLNLTAAEYVFLLDPWWNPAVESQAIDRAHRIGQAEQVFAYRLITRGTVEEKVVELQQSKRDVAAAIISGDNSLIRTLQREDLELLLS